MAKEWTLTESFAHFGTRRVDLRRSWSARNEETRTVVAALWSDRFRWKARPLSYGEHEQPIEDGWVQTFGNVERLENLLWARDHYEGLFNVVMVWAKDVTAARREIASSAPREDLVMRLVDIDERAGKFLAERVVRAPVIPQ